MLEDFMRYRVELKEDEKRNYVNWTVMHFARFDAWIDGGVMKMSTGTERGAQRQTTLTIVCGRHLRRVVTGILKMAWEAVESMNYAELDNDGMGDGERRAVCGTSKKIASRVTFAKRLY